MAERWEREAKRSLDDLANGLSKSEESAKKFNTAGADLAQKLQQASSLGIDVARIQKEVALAMGDAGDKAALYSQALTRTIDAEIRHAQAVAQATSQQKEHTDSLEKGGNAGTALATIFGSAVLGGAIGGFVANAGQELIKWLKDMAEYIPGRIADVAKLEDQMHLLAQQTGVNIQSLSGLQVIAKVSGLSMEELAHGIERFDRNILEASSGTGTAVKAFQDLQISVKDSAGHLKDGEALLKEVADKFSGMEDSAGKTALAIELFSRAGARMIPMLNEGSEGIKKMQEEAKKMGIVFDAEAAEAAHKLNENMETLKGYGQGFWVSVASPIIDGLVKITGAMRDARREGDGFWGSIFAGLGKFGQTIAGVADDKQEMETITTQLQRRYKERARVQGQADQGFHVEGQLKSIDAMIAPLETRRNELAAAMAVGNSTDYSEVPSAGTPKAKAPVRGPKEKSDMGDASKVLGQARDMFETGELPTREDYVEYLSFLAEQWKGSEDARLHISAEAAKEGMKLLEEQIRERQKLDDDASKAALALTKHQQDEERRQEEAGRQQRLQDLNADFNSRAKMIEQNVWLNGQEKAEQLRTLADELDAYKAYQGNRKEIDDEQRRLRTRATEEEVKYQQDVMNRLRGMFGQLSLDVVGIFQGMHTGIQKELEGVIRGHVDLTKSVGHVWQGMVDAAIKEVARLGANAIMKPLLDPLKKVFTDVWKDITSEMKPIFQEGWDWLKSTAKSAWDWIKGFFAQTDWSSALSGLGNDLMGIVSDFGGGLSSVFSSLTGGGGGDSFLSNIPIIGNLFGGSGGGGDILGTVASFFGFASGTDTIVTKPTLFMAGENNSPERLTVSPLSGAAHGHLRDGGGSSFNFYGPVVMDEYTARRFKQWAKS